MTKMAQSKPNTDKMVQSTEYFQRLRGQTEFVHMEVPHNNVQVKGLDSLHTSSSEKLEFCQHPHYPDLTSADGHSTHCTLVGIELQTSDCARTPTPPGLKFKVHDSSPEVQQMLVQDVL
ncbi:hypothetical protein ACTXT7_007861 [Hymenolepis weldensis]